MSVASTDLVVYGCASEPQDDVSTTGGAIDTTTRIIFDSSALANVLNDKVTVLSSAAGDNTQTVTVTGRNTAGSIVTDVINLNGTTAVNGVVVFQRILKIVISAAHTGSITVKEFTAPNTVIVTIETGVLTIRRMFYNAIANATGGATKTFYEKCFFKNNNGTNSLLSAQISKTADPAALMAFALENAVNDTESVANRLTAPSTVTAFDSTAKNVPGTDLASGAAIGCWMQMTLPAGTAPQETTFTMQIAGSTT